MSISKNKSDQTNEAMLGEIEKQTITDFGEQWNSYTENPGYYGSSNLLLDIFGQLLKRGEIKNAHVAEIGSGTGRIVNMLLDEGVAHVIAVEPSDAFEVLKKNTESRKKQITYIRESGESISNKLQLDYIFSIGVIHHIPEPMPTITAAWGALRPGGKILIWVYGEEGNETYLKIIKPLRMITKKLPHAILILLCSILSIFLNIYIFLCSMIPLPMHTYMRNVLAKFPYSVRHMTIYDQLNPAYSKYYTQNEAIALLHNAHFEDIKSFRRHGYSWTLIGTKSER